MNNSVDSWFKHYTDQYSTLVHIPITMSICSFGVIANTLNVVVLRHRSMVGPTTTILMVLAMSQLGLLVSNILRYVVRITTVVCEDHHSSYGEIGTVWMLTNACIAFHSVALTMNVVLAMFRLIVLRWPVKSRNFVTVQLARKVCAIASGIVCVSCVPVYLCTVITPYEVSNMSKCFEGTNKTLYILDYGPQWSLDVTMWFYGVVMKVMPCIIVTVLCGAILKIVRKKEQRVIRSLLQQNHLLLAPGITMRDRRRMEAQNRISRTTKLLVLIVSLCAVVELPNGVMCCIVALRGREFAHEVYNQMGDIFDMLTLLYSSINFILYCSISSMFRNAFNLTFTTNQFASTSIRSVSKRFGREASSGRGRNRRPDRNAQAVTEL